MGKQPPSGGCVLKLKLQRENKTALLAATFGWLCVETAKAIFAEAPAVKQPPSGGCVLKPKYRQSCLSLLQAATFGWLCVETVSSTTFC